MKSNEIKTTLKHPESFHPLVILTHIY